MPRSSRQRWLPVYLLAVMAVFYQLQWLITIPALIPRHPEGLPGIITAPFVHYNFQHLAANAMPFLLLSYLTIAGIGSRYLSALAFITIAGGTLLWFIGRPGHHIGASILVYGLFAFLLTNACYKRSAVNIVIAVTVAFLYSGLIWGILPLQAGVSFEGHICGAIGGYGYARLNRTGLAKKGRY
jgi:membrane associated rhomboid family serine protease